MCTISRRPARRTDRLQAFSMVDLVVTLLIMGILAAVTAPRFTDSLQRRRPETAAARVRADLILARKRAIAQSNTQQVRFAPDLDEYNLPGVDSLDRPDQTYRVRLSEAPYEAAIVSAELGGDPTIEFDHFGNPDSEGTITVAAGAYQQTVTIDAAGRVTIP